MSIKSIIVLLIFLAIGVFLFMNRDKVMNLFRGGMGQEQMQEQAMPRMQDMQEEIMIEEDASPEMEG